MNFLEANLMALGKLRPDLAGRVVSHIQNGGLPSPQKDPQGRDNLPFSGPSQHHGWLYSGSLEADLNVLPVKIREVYNPQIMIWLGLGLGCHLIAYLKNPHPLNRFLVIVEPSLNYFCRFLSMGDYGELLKNPRIFWLVGIPAGEIDREMLAVSQFPGFSESAENHLIVEWGYADPYFARFKDVWNQLDRFLKQEAFNVPIDNFYGLMNFFENLKTLPDVPLLQEFKGVFQGQPGIVVSTGPSLSLSLERLKGVQDKAVIFGVDSALRILQNNQIRPHLTGCLERVPATARHFEGVDTSRTVLFATPIIDPVSHRIYRGPKVHVVRKHHFLPWFLPFAEGHDLGLSSVSHLGLYVLWSLGCGPIYLLGQDLAFDPVSQKTHAEGYDNIGSTDREGYLSVGSHMIRVRSNRGDEIETDTIWNHFGQQTTCLIRQLGIDCCNIIPQNYGIEVAGAKRLDPEDAFSRCFSHPLGVDGVEKPLRRVFERFEGDLKGKYRSSMDQVWPTTKGHLQKILEDCVATVREIYDAYAAHLPALDRGNLSETFRPLFQRIEARANEITENPVYEKFFRPLVLGRNTYLSQRSYALLGEEENKPETVVLKLSISLSWFCEAIVRAQMVLSRLEGLEGKVSAA